MTTGKPAATVSTVSATEELRPAAVLPVSQILRIGSARFGFLPVRPVGVRTVWTIAA